jgi:hypothetical protein
VMTLRPTRTGLPATGLKPLVLATTLDLPVLLMGAFLSAASLTSISIRSLVPLTCMFIVVVPMMLGRESPSGCILHNGAAKANHKFVIERIGNWGRSEAG